MYSKISDDDDDDDVWAVLSTDAYVTAGQPSDFMNDCMNAWMREWFVDTDRRSWI